MRTVASSLFAASLTMAAPLSASTATDFYVGLLLSGTGAIERGKAAEAVQPLRIAAFGLVDSLELYQTAQIYLALAYENLGRHDDARLAAQRVVTAERIQPTFGRLTVPAAVLSDFLNIAGRVMPDSDRQLLARSPVPARTASPPPSGASVPTPPNANPAPALSQEPAALPQTPAPQAASPPPQVSSPQVSTSTSVQAPPQTKPSSPPASETPRKPARPAEKVPTSKLSPAAIDSRLTEAQRHLETTNLAAASRAYRGLLGAGELNRSVLLRIGEGLYRARDFQGTIDAFRRLDTLQSGEEPYHYYIAVAFYETGDFAGARREMAAALPHIALTADVERYRAKIFSRVE